MGIEPDLDGSAKASIILSFFEESGFSECMVKNFDAPKCLKTYSAERDPSISANCNALLSIILDTNDYPSKCAAIEKITTFICDSCFNTQGSVNDKWVKSPMSKILLIVRFHLPKANAIPRGMKNLSPYYPAMLMARSLTELLHEWDAGKLPQVASSLLVEKVVPVLLKCLVRTMQSQQFDGSWGSIGLCEETAYAVLTLASLRFLPLAQFVRSDITYALQRGRNFLLGMKGRKPEYLWIEKVTYGSKYLAETYVVAASFTSVDESGEI